jgi:uroporphyrinogen-III decarboxylase
MRFEAFIYAMADEPDQMQRIMDIIDAAYDEFYEQLIAGPVRLINYGENIAQAHMSPAYFERYLLPWYEKRVGQLRAGGIFTHIHIDGYFKELIPHIAKLPHDGLEALTPLPQGDVTLDEMEQAVGDKVLLDGIPAILFLEHHPMEQLQQCVEELCDRFADRLVLGVSDELPQAATEVGYERLKWVADYARNRKLATS